MKAHETDWSRRIWNARSKYTTYFTVSAINVAGWQYSMEAEAIKHRFQCKPASPPVNRHHHHQQHTWSVSDWQKISQYHSIRSFVRPANCMTSFLSLLSAVKKTRRFLFGAPSRTQPSPPHGNLVARLFARSFSRRSPCLIPLLPCGPFWSSARSAPRNCGCRGALNTVLIAIVFFTARRLWRSAAMILPVTF